MCYTPLARRFARSGLPLSYHQGLKPPAQNCFSPLIPCKSQVLASQLLSVSSPQALATAGPVSNGTLHSPPAAGANATQHVSTKLTIVEPPPPMGQV